MKRNQNGGPVQIDTLALFRALHESQRAAAKMIERRRADAVDTPLFLAHGDYARPRQLRGGEVNMAELGERVANGIVDGSFTHLAAFDMSQRDAEGQRDRGGRQHFISVRDE